MVIRSLAEPSIHEVRLGESVRLAPLSTVPALSSSTASADNYKTGEA
jgi:hypothetical protein